MIKQRFIIIFCTIIFGFSNWIKAQDVSISQYYANLLYLNPAYAGSEICPRISLNSRTQWPGLRANFQTYSASYDQHSDFLQGGIGFQIVQDAQGDGAIKTTSISAAYSYDLKINRFISVKGGFQASYFQRSIDKSNMIFADMIDPLHGIIYETKEILPDLDKKFFDVSAGFIAYSKQYYLGFAVHHLTEPGESNLSRSDDILARKYTLHFGTTIPLTSERFKRGELSISPNFLYQKQSDNQQLNYGLYLNRLNIVGGIWLRHNLKFERDSWILLLGYVKDNYKISYSYDLTVSELGRETLGAHEITLTFMLPCKPKTKIFKAINCPSF